MLACQASGKLLYANLYADRCEHVSFKQDPGKAKWSVLSYLGLGKKKLKTSDIGIDMI